MSEQISTLLDGELPVENFSKELNSLLGNKKSQQLWRNYQLIGDAMRDVPQLSDDFTARLMEKIELEPTVLAPSALPRVMPQSVQHHKSTLSLPWAMAASCAAVLMVGWALVNQQWQATPEAAMGLAAVTTPQRTQPAVPVQTAAVQVPMSVAQSNQENMQIVEVVDHNKSTRATEKVAQQSVNSDVVAEESAPIAPLEYLAAHHATAPSVGSYYIQTASYSE